MATVTVTEREGVAMLQLTHGVTNAIDPQLVSDLSEALKRIQDDARGMILCGGGKFFSLGLNLPVLLPLKRSEMSHFWEQFNDLCLKLFTIAMPTACVLAGHAVAGGNILALTCDYRFGVEEKRQIGLNEIKLGVPVPYLADMMLRHTIGDRWATHMIYSGDFMPFTQAAAIGLIDQIAPADTLETLALNHINGITRHPFQAFSTIKATKVERIAERYRRHFQAKNEAFITCWFSDKAQALLNAAAEKF